VIEAKVDVDRLLKHEDWQVRFSALDIVWSGLGATDGIETTMELLLHDTDEDIRAHSTLALYEAAKGTPKENAVREVFRRVAKRMLPTTSGRLPQATSENSTSAIGSCEMRPSRRDQRHQ